MKKITTTIVMIVTDETFNDKTFQEGLQGFRDEDLFEKEMIEDEIISKENNESAKTSLIVEEYAGE